jgi:ribosomal protein L16 Arg81 hydroxylase
MRYEREITPLLQVELHAGDWLYIPCGYWHQAETPPGSDVSITIAVGIMAPTALDVLQLARQHLAQSLLWRLRIRTAAVTGTERAAIRDTVAELIPELRRDLTRLFDSPFFESSLIEHFSRSPLVEPSGDAPPSSEGVAVPDHA